MHFMPQRATLTPFRSPVSAISYFGLFDFRPEIFEKLSKTFKISITDVGFLTEKSVVVDIRSIQKIMFKYSWFINVLI